MACFIYLKCKKFASFSGLRLIKDVEMQKKRRSSNPQVQHQILRKVHGYSGGGSRVQVRAGHQVKVFTQRCVLSFT